MNAIRQLAARLRRLHPVTWCVTAVVTVVMVIIVVPGEIVYHYYPRASDDQQSIRKEVRAATYSLIQDRRRQSIADESPVRGPSKFTFDVFEHGWPGPYLVRSRVYLRYYDPIGEQVVDDPPRWEPWISWHPSEDEDPFGFGVEPYFELMWSNPEHWPYQGDVWHWQWGNLLLDVAFLLSIVAIVAVATERWIRWRGGLLRLRVAELLVGITICALSMGWVTYHKRIAKIEDKINALMPISINDQTEKGQTLTYYSLNINTTYVGSHWLRRLVGDVQYLPLLHHATECTWYGYESQKMCDDRWRQEFALIKQLKYLQNLTLRTRSVRNDGAASYLPIFSSASIPKAPMLHVEQLHLHGHCFLKEDIEAVCQMIATERLVLTDVALTDEEFKQLEQNHPQIDFEFDTWLNSTDLGLPYMPPADLVNFLRNQRQRASANSNSD